MLKITNPHPLLNEESISTIEKAYSAKFVCETTIKNRNGNWINTPVAVFYTETPHPEGSNWFGFYNNEEGKFLITNAISALEPFDALLLEDNSIFYSRYRHDYRELNDGTMVDGGRDYIRSIPGKGKHVKVKIVNEHLEIIDGH